MRNCFDLRSPAGGFALVVAISMMVLLMVLGVSFLSLAAITSRQSDQSTAMREAQANARMALMIAMGELQSEMGPDMRVSANASIHDQNPETAPIDGVAHPHWLGCYDAWGNWLTAPFTNSRGQRLQIGDTYVPGREPMFRRWLVSLPRNLQTDIDAAKSALNDDAVVLVGPGSAGQDAADHVRAYRVKVGERGRYAWWIGAENQKARADHATMERNLPVSEWELAQGNTAEVGIGAVQGFEALDEDADLAQRMISFQTLQLAGVSDHNLRRHFHHLTTRSRGLLADVRRGGLKRDLSLLLEKSGSALPTPYKFNSSDVQEPSIRPMSPELLANNPHIPMRHFQSWTNLRHYYRMYHQLSDANTGGSAGTGGSASLEWSGTKPQTSASGLINIDRLSVWNGSNNYWRFPIVAKYTIIYSLMTRPSTFGGRYELFLVHTPVMTYWNPYNVELRVPDKVLGHFMGAPRVWPISGEFYVRDSGTGRHKLHDINFSTGINYSLGSPTGLNNVFGWLSSGDGSDIVFKPGQFRVFSLQNYTDRVSWGENHLMPGFDPLGIDGGDMLRFPRIYYQNEEPAMSLRFGIGGWVFNMNNGNTPGSLCLLQAWQTRGNDPPMMYQHDWLRADAKTTPRLDSEGFTQITLDPEPVNRLATKPQNLERWVFDGQPHPIAFMQLVLKTATPLEYESIDWARKDWRGRTWIQSPPNYNGSSMYISENQATADTQRWDNPYCVNFGPLSNPGDAVALVDPFTDNSIAKYGSGTAPVEQVSEVAALELPTAPISSLAGFSGMRINPGWVNPQEVIDASSQPKLRLGSLGGASSKTNEASAYSAEVKIYAYQSGVTGPGIGNSFMHPMLPRTGVYRDYDNSRSMDPMIRDKPENYTENDLKLFRDYWDHVFLLNDALWDGYFLSSLATRSRPSDSGADSLSESIQRLVAGEAIPNSRYAYHDGGLDGEQVKQLLTSADGYLKAAGHLVVDGMFNVNSTSVPAWYALFAGIRERKAVHRNRNGQLEEIKVPAGKRIVLTRFNTEIAEHEMSDPEFGAPMPSGDRGWSGVRFLDDDQLYKLAEECVKQVKRRGPFLNYSEFINRRLSDDELGTMGALQSAIDYDDGNPDSGSINHMFKNDPQYMIRQGELAGLEAGTPEAAVGSRFAGAPGYVIQSDLLRPIGNTLTVRDDTFRIRAYGESLNPDGTIAARAWCEAIVQRLPEYADPSDDPHLPVRELNGTGEFEDSLKLSKPNMNFGRTMRLVNFRWLNSSEV